MYVSGQSVVFVFVFLILINVHLRAWVAGHFVCLWVAFPAGSCSLMKGEPTFSRPFLHSLGPRQCPALVSSLELPAEDKISSRAV